MANAQLEVGNTQAAVIQFREALRMRPRWISAANNLAWVLATSPKSDVRNGPEAVQLAEQVCRDTAHRVPSLLGTLAAAYAEAGRFDEAVATTHEAVELALKLRKTDLAEQLEQRLRDYTARRPYRS